MCWIPGSAQHKPVKQLVCEEYPDCGNRSKSEITGRPCPCYSPEKAKDRPSDYSKRLGSGGQAHNCLQAVGWRFFWTVACQHGTYTPPWAFVTVLGMILAMLVHFLVPGGETTKRLAAYMVLGVSMAASIYVTWIDTKESRAESRVEDKGTWRKT